MSHVGDPILNENEYKFALESLQYNKDDFIFYDYHIYLPSKKYLIGHIKWIQLNWR